jgi:pyruvate formate lyase activating enzyme
MDVCDGVMLDVKATDPKFHQQLTKFDNTSVLNNLRYLLSVNKLTEVRIVCLPRFDEQNRKTIEDVVIDCQRSGKNQADSLPAVWRSQRRV